MTRAKARTRLSIVLTAALFTCCLPSAFAEPPGTAGEAPAIAANFTLTDQSGVAHELHALPDAPAIVIATFADGDAYSQETVKTLNELRSVFGKASYFMLSSSAGETAETATRSAELLHTDIPILIDNQQVAARALGLSQTGEAVVIDPVGWKIAYRGPVSALSAKDPQAPYLLFNAVVHVMGHRVVGEPRVETNGTPIAFTASP